MPSEFNHTTGNQSIHILRDADSTFVVDPLTRVIKSNNQYKTTLIQFDHNSEVFDFYMPRYIEGHDMTNCNRIECHYVNTDATTGVQTKGVYEIDDLSVTTYSFGSEETEAVKWSWLVSRNATEHVGTLGFSFRFACVEEEEIVYSWSTLPLNTITISKGFYNSEAVIEKYADILEQWERKIGVGISNIKQTVKSDESNGINEVVIILTDNREYTFEVRNGKTPIVGVDYYTEADKNQMFMDVYNKVITEVPIAEGASF